MLLLLLFLSLLLIAQGTLTLLQMLYAWEDPEKVARNKPPRRYAQPEISFTALIPARHEQGVIADTLKAIASINYPTHLKEVFIICRFDDYETILKARKTIDQLKLPNIKIITFDGDSINKPHALNIGLQHSKNDVIVVFDAEDEPHRDIYSIVNTVMLHDNADVVQGGVQLMNFRSNWFATLNVLEYYFWFKSSLQFFANNGFILLGGNTVFMRKKLLEEIGGWDENCLTEDADLGIRMSVRGANMRIIYDEMHTTKEETPATVTSFIKQRTRWNQGFMQVFRKGEWLTLPTVSQRLLAGYALLWPILQALLFLFVPLSLFTAFYLDLPVWVAILSTIPLYLLGLQFLAYNIGLFEFTREYVDEYPLWMPLKLLVTFFPFQFLLGISTLRALIRYAGNNKIWEKTEHYNAHRVTA